MRGRASLRGRPLSRDLQKIGQWNMKVGGWWVNSISRGGPTKCGDCSGDRDCLGPTLAGRG